MPPNIKNRLEYMETGENHLGGYIKSGKNLENGDPNSWTPQLWKWIVKNLEIKSLIDVGCGEGHSTKFFNSLGCETIGVEGSPSAIKNSPVPELIKRHDYTKEKYIPSKKYNAVWCCEFVEHVDEKYEKNFLETFKYANKYIFLTHALPGQAGWHHVNCKKKSYWIEELNKIGYKHDAFLTKTLKYISEKGHFKNTGLVFINKDFSDSYNREKIKISVINDSFLKNITDKSLLKKRFLIDVFFEVLISVDYVRYKSFKLKERIDAIIGKIGEMIKARNEKIYFFLKNLITRSDRRG